MAWTSGRFRKDNPELYGAFLDAVKEATSIIAADPKGTAQSWINDSNSKLPLEMVTKVVTGPGVEWTMTPAATMKFAKVHAPGRHHQARARHPGRTCSCPKIRRAERELEILRPADQYPDREHDGAAEHDLEHRLQERRVHVARADEGDRP